MRGRLSWLAVTGVIAVGVMGLAPAVAGASARYRIGPISDISAACAGQNAEVEQAVDPLRGYVYEEWMGCGGIGFARSTDGGLTFQAPITLPGSTASKAGSWDPALSVAPNGTVYAAYMTGGSGDRTFPVVDASFDHGASFPQSTALKTAQSHNWGDRDFIAVGPNGAVYVTWDYGPSASQVTFICAPNGSCSFATGDLNVVMQTSTDGGRTFGPMSHISPGFPASGADSAPLVVEPGGRIDVLYQGYSYTNLKTLTLGSAYSYFTSSSNGGQTWSAPVAVGPQAGTMNTAEWWIDGALALDAGGNLYATWDTQGTGPGGAADDIAWLSYSTDHGVHWSSPLQAPSDQRDVPHIIEVTGGRAGLAYVGWLSNSNPLGYALYLRTFSIAGGWQTAPTQVSSAFGESSVWPGDTFGISTYSPTRLDLSWGSATPATDHQSEIYATPVGTG